MRIKPLLIIVTGLGISLALSSCALLNAAKQRLNILGVSFAFKSLDVGRLIFPAPAIGLPLESLAQNKSLLSGFGVDILCTLKATNHHAERAVFDGVTGRLRIEDTSSSAPAIAAPFPAFAVAANSDTDFTVTFPLRLDQPVFSKATLKKIVTGADIPYLIDANMTFKLAGTILGKTDSLGSQSVNLKVTTGTVNSKAAASAALDRLLKILDLAL